MTAENVSGAIDIADAHTNDADKTRYMRQKPQAQDNASAYATQGAVVHEGMQIKERYLLESKIGSGGMSDIYRATDLFLQQAGVKNSVVAIKVLQHQFVDEPDALQLLLQEAHRTQQLSHPNIVRVFDVDCDKQLHFIVMELFDGESLDQIIKRYKPKGLPLKSAIKLLQQIADALNYAHRMGIVHADLKPANIMVNRAGDVKLLDFGVSQKVQMNHDIYAAESHEAHAPANGYTPAYASLQLLQGMAPTVADDVYSFACLAYELLTSKHPFERLPSDAAKAQSKQAAKPSALSLLQWQTFKQALEFDSQKRQISLTRLMKALNFSIWPTAAAAAIVLSAASGLWWYISQQQATLQQYVQQSNSSDSKQHEFEQLAASPVATILATLGTQDISPYQRDAILRQQQSSIIAHYEQQMDALLSDRSSPYPDYPQIEYLLGQAKALYPDSHYLTGLQNSLELSKQTALEVVRGQLSQLLLEQQYQRLDEGNDVYALDALLKRIDNGYIVTPDDTETEKYIQAFDQAKTTNDAVALQQLIWSGELFFANHAATAELVSGGQALADAVSVMAQYTQKVATAPDTPFPYQAAETFYQHSFTQLAEQLEQSQKANEVDAVYDKLSDYGARVPADFSLHVQLRRKLADKYLALSGQLLQSNQVRTAERLMRRANELMNSLAS